MFRQLATANTTFLPFFLLVHFSINANFFNFVLGIFDVAFVIAGVAVEICAFFEYICSICYEIAGHEYLCFGYFVILPYLFAKFNLDAGYSRCIAAIRTTG